MAYSTKIDRLPYAVSAGGPLAYTVTVPDFALTTGFSFELNLNVSNTGPSTLNANASGVKPLLDADLNPLALDDIEAGSTYLLSYNTIFPGGAWQAIGLAKPLGAHVIDFNGIPLPQQPVLDFTGLGVSVFDGPGGKTTVNIPLAAASTCLLPTVTQTVYVVKGGNNLTGDGSICKPFLTVARALLSIVDASLTKLYTISVGSGEFIETTILLKPFVLIAGTSRETTLLNITTTLGLDPSFSATIGTAPTGLKDLQLNGFGPLSASFNLQLIGGVGSSIIYLEHVSSIYQFFFIARTPQDSIRIENSFLVTSHYFGGNLYISNTFATGNLEINSGVSVDPMRIEIYSLYGRDCQIDVTNTTSSNMEMYFIGGQITLAMLLTAAVTKPITIFYDTLPPVFLPSPAGINLSPMSNAKGQRYDASTPAISAAWSGINPLFLKDALDRIALFLGPIP